jgi:hypothetical protein
MFLVQALLTVGGLLTLAFINVVDHCIHQGLILKSIVSDDFYFVSTFAGSGEARNKIAHLLHSNSW